MGHLWGGGYKAVSPWQKELKGDVYEAGQDVGAFRVLGFGRGGAARRGRGFAEDERQMEGGGVCEARRLEAEFGLLEIIDCWACSGGDVDQKERWW